MKSNIEKNNSSRPKVIITGANGGIGLSTLKKFVKNGWYICACVRTKSVELNKALGNKGSTYILDLSDQSSVIDCAKNIISKEKRIDVLINCAGIAHGSLFSMTRIEDLKNIFQVNFFAQILFSQYIAKNMMRYKNGSIINISSTSSILADSGSLAYGCSKAALSHATRIMATELGAFGIRVNGIAPAKVETKMGKLMDEKSSNLLEQRASLKGNILPENIADLIYFLASEESQMINGQVLRIDKGLPF